MQEEYTLRAVLFQQHTDGESWWIAQCIEHDISAQARHMRDAINELGRMVSIQICACKENGIEPLTSLPKSPEKFRMMFNEGMRVEESEIKVPEVLLYPKHQEVRIYA